MITRRHFAIGSAALATAGCSPLAFFDTVNPRDAGGAKVASAAYGPDARQALDVYAPTGARGRAPVAVFFYGGSWTSGSKAEYGFVGQALAAAGFVTVLPDYRLHPAAPFPAFLEDCAQALRWAQDNAAAYGGDPGRIVLAGHSAGAYNAAMLALNERYLTQAGSDRRAIRAWAGLSGPYDFLPLDPGTAQEVFGAVPDKRSTQPITFAGPGDPPAFLATGDRDTTVRPKNTAALAARLREAGVPVVERTYPGLDHADTLLALSVFFRDKAPVLAEMTAFLRERAG